MKRIKKNKPTKVRKKRLLPSANIPNIPIATSFLDVMVDYLEFESLLSLVPF